MKYFDYNGNEVDEQWFRAEFGAFTISRPAGAHLQVSSLSATTGRMALFIHVLDQDGAPLTGAQVVYSWPGAPDLPGAGWTGRGIVLDLKPGAGYAEAIMGGGEAYNPQIERGPAECWILGRESDRIEGLGWLMGTNHHHFDVVFQQVSDLEPEPPPPEEPGQGDYAAVVALLTSINETLDEIEPLLEEMRDAVIGG